MNNHKHSETAFPWKHSTGMTLRDYFAAKAMQSLLASGNMTGIEAIEMAYEYADCMLEVRNNERK